MELDEAIAALESIAELLRRLKGTGATVTLGSELKSLTPAPHHPTWEEGRRSFFAQLKQCTPPVLDNYDVVARFCESKGMPRPSHMTPEQRDRLIALLNLPEKRFIYEEWCGMHGGNE